MDLEEMARQLQLLEDRVKKLEETVRHLESEMPRPYGPKRKDPLV
jgi:hypothetical protein